jgi:hypothetical protein
MVIVLSTSRTLGVASTDPPENRRGLQTVLRHLACLALLDPVVRGLFWGGGFQTGGYRAQRDTHFKLKTGD